MNSAAKITLVFLGFMQAGFSIPRKPECGDFLRERKIALPGLRFLDCRPGKNAQLNTLIARYTVPGYLAKSGAVILAREFRMAPPVFRCCGWEVEGGKHGAYTDAQGYSHAVSLTSGETLEKKWEKIPAFTVTDELFIDEP
jgi:Domian of unknown function (DUF4952)